MSPQSTESLHALIAVLSNQATPPADLASVGGGDTHQAFSLTLAGEAFFLKVNRASALAQFKAEAHSLDALNNSSGTLTFPQAVACDCAGPLAGLLLSTLTFCTPSSDAGLGTGLALLHRNTAADFGFDRDNFIGATPQINTPDTDWIRFYRTHRLQFQRDRACSHGLSGRVLAKVDAVIRVLPDFFTEYQPVASLLHGDLWAGNAGMLSNGDAAVFDP